MGFKNFSSGSNKLLQAICQRKHLRQILNLSQCVCRRSYTKVPPTKIPCSPAKPVEPAYFKTPTPCKTDEELRTEPTLGVYLRCKPPYKPECMDPCYNLTLFDHKFYKPSKSLDRKFEKYWVDCVMEGKSERRSIMTPPEIERRTGPNKGPCNKKEKSGSPTMCRTMKPLKCRPLTPAAATDAYRCIKYPLCECPKSRRFTLCKLKGKSTPTCRRPMTRYPSYSECKSLPVNDGPITECPKRISLCESWRVFRNRHG